MTLSLITRKFLALLRIKEFPSRNHLKKQKLSHNPKMFRNLLNYPAHCYSDSKPTSSDEITNIHNHPDFTAVTEIIKDRFYFATLSPGKREPKHSRNTYMFSIDDELIYYNFFDDFGPLSIASLYKYCHGVNKVLKNPEHKAEKIVHFTCANPNKRANAAYLAASYSLLYLKREPLEIYESITSKNAPPFRPFQDASMGDSQFTIKIIDCLNALHKAASLGFFNFDDFDVKEYEKYEKIKHGDMHWIVPQKFLSFPGPSTERNSNAHYPEKYLNYFMKNQVAAVVRLNRKAYESFRFTNAGIEHYDMFFPDGGVPPKKILKEFLHVAENTKGAIAVHCKAGLGRTGTLIAAYIMKHYYISAKEAIAWLRICRPGSVIGHQQSWLEDMENHLWREGRRYRLKHYGNENLVLHHKEGIYSIAAKSDRNIQSNDRLKEKSLNVNIKTEKSKVCEESVIKNPCPRRTTIEDNENLSNEKRKRIMTQGDKLNEIKIKRSLMNAGMVT